MKVKNIIFDAERMKYPHTGLYHFCKGLGNSISNSCPIDKNVHFFLNNKVPRIFGPNAKYVRQQSIHKFLKPNYKGIDLWHSTFQLSEYLPCKKSIKVISTIHDLNFLKEDKSKARRMLYLNQVQKTIDRSSTIVAISNYVKEDILNHCKVGDKPVYVIYNGCNMNHLLDVESTELTPIVDGEYIYSLGTVNRKKNIHTLPFLLVGNKLKLVFSGIVHEAEYLEKIKSIASKLGVSDRVIYTGPVTEAEKLNYLQNCTVFAFPSIAEGFGLPVIEAMALGKKVLLSTYTSLPEVGGKEAFYFKETSEDYMLNFAKSDLLEILNGESREKEIKGWASQFTWERAAGTYWELYDQLL